MNYEEFRTAWDQSLRASKLPILAEGWETISLSEMERQYRVVVEPFQGQEAPRFLVTAELSWAWDALKTARSRTCEEDTLAELLGSDDAEGTHTAAPWLRVDVTLRASTPCDGLIAMPDASTWATWVKDMTANLERIGPLLPMAAIRGATDSPLELLGWNGHPEVVCRCGPDGELKVKMLERSASVIIALPRQWDDSDRDPDDPPDDQLAEFFGRVKASLYAWMQALDHLRPKR
jgi:hypothetical protein